MDSLADNVSVVDLTDRARGTARRLRVMRTVVAGVAVLAVAMGITVGSVVLPSAFNGSPAAGDAKGGRYLFEAPEGDWDADGNTPTHHLKLVTWHPGEEPRTIHLKQSYYVNSGRVSPNGTMYSYVGGDDAVHIVNLDSGKEIDIPSGKLGITKVPMGDNSLPETIPAWSPDSGSLWVDNGIGDHRFGFVDLGSGDFTPTYDASGLWDVQVVRGKDNTERLIGLRLAGKGTEIVSVGAGEKSQPKVLGGKLADGDGYATHIAAASTDGKRLCVQTDAKGEVDKNDNTCEEVATFDEHLHGYRDTGQWMNAFIQGTDKCVTLVGDDSGEPKEIQVSRCDTGKVVGTAVPPSGSDKYGLVGFQPGR
jgi:hypothetical protein